MVFFLLNFIKKKHNFSEIYIDILKNFQYDSSNRNLEEKLKGFWSTKRVKYTEKSWYSIFEAFNNHNNKYRISDLPYLYLVKRAMDKYNELRKKARTFDVNFEKLMNEYIEESKRKHNILTKEYHKETNLKDDLLGKLRNVNLFTRNIKKIHINHHRKSVQFEEPILFSQTNKKLNSTENNNNYTNNSYSNNFNHIGLVNETDHSISNFKVVENNSKKITHKNLANIVCGDIVYQDTQKIKLLEGKYFSAYIYIDEDITNEKKKEDGKSIKAVVNNNENNTIFVEKFNLNDQRKKIGFNSSIGKLKKIRQKSLSEIPIKFNMNQRLKLSLSKMNESKKSIYETDKIRKNQISNNSLNFNFNINLQLNQSSEKSNYNESYNKFNNSCLEKSTIKTNSIKTSITPIIINDFSSKNKQREDKANKLVNNMNLLYGLKLNNKNTLPRIDIFRKEDFYYEKKFKA